MKFGPVEFGTYMELEAGAIGGPRTMLSTADVEFGPVEFRHLSKIRGRSTRESANGALDDECENKSTGKAVNGALNNKWRSEGQRVELQGQESQKQHARMGRTNSVRPDISCIPPRTEMLGFFRRYILIVTL